MNTKSFDSIRGFLPDKESGKKSSTRPDQIWNLRPSFYVTDTFDSSLSKKLLFIPKIYGKYMLIVDFSISDLPNIIQKLEKAKKDSFVLLTTLLPREFVYLKRGVLNNIYHLNDKFEEKFLLTKPDGELVFLTKRNYVLLAQKEIQLYSRKGNNLIDKLDLMENCRIFVKSNAKSFFYTYESNSKSFHRIKIRDNKLENRRLLSLWQVDEIFSDCWISKEEILMVTENKIISYDRVTGTKKNVQVKKAVSVSVISSTLFLLQCKDKTQLFKRNEKGNWIELQYFNFNASDCHIVIPIPVTKKEIQEKTSFLSSVITDLPPVLVREVIKFCDES